MPHSAGGPGAGLPGEAEKKYDYIDAVRGWAILLVITCHVGGRFAGMPYPIKKLTNFGWHGVQLFFLASAVTLMMSWHRQNAKYWTATGRFFVRRFLRIAPLYYTGALIYYVVEPPPAGFDLAQMLRTFLFVNAWRPDWIPTTPGWMVVPGGWSIGVEFTFYAVFPLLASVCTTLSRAVLLAAATLVLAVVANHFGSIWLQQYDGAAVRNFLYFWFPNQAPVFALGIVLYYLVTQTRVALAGRVATYALIAAVGVVCVVAAELPSASDRFQSFTSVPTLLIASLSLMVFFVALAKGSPGIFVHPWIRRLGILSFGGYVLHFLFVDLLPGWTGGWIDVDASGFAAIGMFLLLWIATMIGTVAAAALAHALIERPGINLARFLTFSRGPASRLVISARPAGWDAQHLERGDVTDRG
jgi:peptidoglycan/LPS O-acetylase OafA/YrhL